MSTETFLQTIWQTVWAYVQQFLPAEVTALAELAPSGDLVTWALAALAVIGGLMLLSMILGD